MVWWPTKDIYTDFKQRAPWYIHDWKQGTTVGIRILAPATYIFFASAIPALTFGEQLYRQTDGLLYGVHTLAATAITGIIQSLVGGQPLLIVGVAEPIILFYGYMYSFASGRPSLGADLFLPWAAWVCIWTACMLLAITALGACRYVHRFTRYCGELFGMLIAVLFLQECIRGVLRNFRPDASTAPLNSPQNSHAVVLENGFWSLFLTAAVILSTLWIQKARTWRYGLRWARAFLADYGVPLLVAVWSFISYASIQEGRDMPRKLLLRNTWQTLTTWHVARRMKDVPPAYIAAALIPALLITVLFYFDHSVSSLLAQQTRFNLRKPPTYSWDLALLGLMTAMCGLLGLPPVNGVLPQAPLHAKRLSEMRHEALLARVRAVANKHRKLGGAELADEIITDAEHFESNAVTVLRQDPQLQQLAERCHAAAAAATGDARTREGGAEYERSLLALTTHVAEIAPVDTQEQRITNLLQSVLCGACLGITIILKRMPEAVLNGYFAYMALESLPGNQLWERFLLLFSDPHRRRWGFEDPSYAWIDRWPQRKLFLFTLLQGLGTGAAYGITWIPIAGIVFPVPILLMVPIRQYLYPYIFGRPFLQDLDPMPGDDDPPSPDHSSSEQREGSKGLHLDVRDPEVGFDTADPAEAAMVHQQKLSDRHHGKSGAAPIARDLEAAGSS
ncbi:hypothetical protein WJX74_003059 [Apatococcus lobatus]|uniref:Bicarbonate transporter-like transmembrane domain-containing protein n=1 Tax=Apatococcus lobatus TaxID=904363 RepID=A0AAW1S9P1_9CHLO